MWEEKFVTPAGVHLKQGVLLKWGPLTKYCSRTLISKRKNGLTKNQEGPGPTNLFHLPAPSTDHLALIYCKSFRAHNNLTKETL